MTAWVTGTPSDFSAMPCAANTETCKHLGSSWHRAATTAAVTAAEHGVGSHAECSLYRTLIHFKIMAEISSGRNVLVTPPTVMLTAG